MGDGETGGSGPLPCRGLSAEHYEALPGETMRGHTPGWPAYVDGFESLICDWIAGRTLLPVR
jgi:hypothetical protein